MSLQSANQQTNRQRPFVQLITTAFNPNSSLCSILDILRQPQMRSSFVNIPNSSTRLPKDKPPKHIDLYCQTIYGPSNCRESICADLWLVVVCDHLLIIVS